MKDAVCGTEKANENKKIKQQVKKHCLELEFSSGLFALPPEPSQGDF